MVPLPIRKRRHFLATWRAPCRPEVQQNDLASVFGELHRPFCEISAYKIWHLIAHSHRIRRVAQQRYQYNGGVYTSAHLLLAVGYPLSTQSVPKSSAIYSAFVLENPSSCRMSNAAATFGQRI